ncbi:hypothetical protein A2886_02680 [candidate division WWE3 bacterium RIFCSPHIGHO2_01_FULL_42_13]|uniref:DUF4349 domain-containing protein n=1 Tax=candidate division WWE3 bacterium RIFCSPHIGHO2_01_FULL_42_13 TaxID=1802617 RepID=A0A1F4US90_UNCKA|nr:MAG: hypothetical protein A2886_02680 [candidate division WWE3 bacterium RIFCSPHIGHO2_01_FULL_42_13]
MQKLITWIKQNKLSAVLIFVVVVLLLTRFDNSFFYNLSYNFRQKLNPTPMGTDVYYNEGYMGEATGAYPAQDMMAQTYNYYGNVVPQLDIEQRKLTKNAYLSVVVEDVNSAISQISARADEVGGYLVSSNATTPEGLASGDISIRVPSDRLSETLEFLRGLSVKVVSENVSGQDITDQYVDVEERLATLNETKARYEEILADATDINDILNVTQQIMYIQDQIDYYTGQLKYLEASANSSLITVYLSTDELQLPYSPEQPWRPNVILKYAVRSLMQNLQDLGSVVIWVLVYAVVWVPLVLAVLFVKQRLKTRK